MRETLKAFDLPEMSDADIRRHTGRGDCSMKALFGEQKENATAHYIRAHDEIYLNDIHSLSGAEALMSWLIEQGVPMSVVTSKGQHRAEAQLEKLGWIDFFSCIIGKLEGRASKPNPAPLLLACQAMGLQPNEVVMIGDGEADMQAAKRAGCLGIGLTHSFSDAELLENGADICFQTLDDVLLCLQGTGLKAKEDV